MNDLNIGWSVKCDMVQGTYEVARAHGGIYAAWFGK